MKRFQKDPFFEEVLVEMVEAADAASKDWLKKATERGPAYAVYDHGIPVGTMLDNCGGAYLKITDGRKSFCRYVKARQASVEGRGQCFSIPVRYPLQCRQEMGLAEAAITAAFGVLKKFSLSEGVAFHSYID